MKKIIVFPLIWIWTILTVFGQTHFKITGGNLKVTDDVNITLHNTKWVNNGTFNATDGTVIFNGDAATSDSKIEGSSETQFYDLKIDKTANNVELSQNTAVSHQLNLQSGLLDIGEFGIDFGTVGFTVFNNQTYILTSGTGNVIRQIESGNSANFIVGDGSCTPLTIQNSGTSDEFLVRVVAEVLENGTTGNPITSGVVNRTWHVEETADDGTDITLTAQWNESDELTDFDRDNCYLSHFENSWDTPAPGAAIGNNPYQISRSNITSLSPFSVASEAVLPVELLSFSAFPKDKKVQLEWQTANEINNSHFEIEHSADGFNFRKIGEVDAVELLEAVNYYDFLHENPVQDLNYYRLKQVDFDGRFEYSKIELVDMPNFEDFGGLVSFYPNPATDRIYFEWSENGNFEVQILDELGRVVLKEKNPISLIVSELGAGVYFGKIINLKNGEVETQRFVKVDG